VTGHTAPRRRPASAAAAAPARRSTWSPRCPSLASAMAVYYMLGAVLGLAIGLRLGNPVQALNNTRR
jgi:hypothetical protein